MPSSATIGTSRRGFLRAGAAAASGLSLGGGLDSWADVLRQRRKSAILLWMSGGPSTIDMWDLKPTSENGGPFKPISTSGEAQICEHLPQLAKQMHHLAVIRSMNTREEDHRRGRYYMHTGFMPSDIARHPGYGAIIAKETISQRPGLELPPSIAISTGSVGPGYLGPRWSPLCVSPEGKLQDLGADLDEEQLDKRLSVLSKLESVFAQRERGVELEGHLTVVENTLRLLRSNQRRALNVMSEPIKTLSRYGLNDFGKGCVLARRLVEAGVPFVEVGFPGWDIHADIFPTLKDRLLPQMDRAMSALVQDLVDRSLFHNTALIWMGEFGRTPRINSKGGRDHWAKAWSVVIGGAGIVGGTAIGETSEDGLQVVSEPYDSRDVLATVLAALGISLETTYKTRSGRELNIANEGRIVEGLGIGVTQTTSRPRRELTDLIEKK